ncbi:MAG: L-aspartate oxidase [Cyanobacteria bacterium]|nr:L-aspartate oxidase [Cyanobacteriota bacterium]
MQEYVNHFDTVVIGSGLAGLNVARKLAAAGQSVFICSKHAITEGSSKYAQGGVAVVSPHNLEDSLESHIADTIKSGQGLCNEAVVSSILTRSWAQVNELIELGVQFDDGFNLEGSHSYNRIMHVGDATGRAIIKPLIDAVSRDNKILVSQGYEAMSLIKLKNGSKVIGVKLETLSGQDMEDINQNVMTVNIWADNIVLATGGLGALFQETTNPQLLRGDGIALAYDAGAKIENLEFVQFHPTVYKTKSGKNFLISEALRGAGAQLRNSKKALFAENYHPDAEMATRDIVSRAIVSEMRKTDSEFVYIDATKLSKEFLKKEFPNIYHYCLIEGYDLATDLLPVRPAAHYSIGGIKTDIHGRTNVESLYAIGECASNGFHGANRLASNSLLECIVCADFIAEAILGLNLDGNINKKLIDSVSQMESTREYDENEFDEDEEIEYCSDYKLTNIYDEQKALDENYDLIRQVISKNLGVERREKSLRSTLKYLESLTDCKEKTVATLLTNSALQRKESRGAHYRVDSPKSLSAQARSTILSKDSMTIKDSDRSRRIILKAVAK